ncbi:MAG: lysophospholipase [Dehalococcoidia bacterium]|nr:lysophospholipase [Dehalococcoidia bacterium]
MKTGETTLESKGATLYAQWWLPEGEPRAVVAIVHGYAEHSGRYAQTAADLVAKGYAVEALDLRGHGRSSGERVYVESYEDYLNDVDAFLERVRGQHPGKKLFLLGHSMGGGVVSSYIIDRKPVLDGVILSGAAMLARREEPPAGAAPTPPRSGPLPAETISRDPAVVAAYESDPLVYRGAPRTARAQPGRAPTWPCRRAWPASPTRYSSSTGLTTSWCRTGEACSSTRWRARQTRRSSCTTAFITKC